ncbi:multidrug resistance-associated ABC transporter [Pholiota conissans]|uniref:Multidrug resistance-associated ABC transporter n=1 Tax=Pholiota conissans TaxID=109636 RepID=A0A9P6CUA5_9AGAR|nr:multidrug resistance-associated ABC transporter [Pholiota conissans]
MPATPAFFDQTSTEGYASVWGILRTTYRDDAWKQPLYIPLLAAALSAVVLLSQALYRKLFSKQEADSEAKFTTDASVDSISGAPATIRVYANAQGGWVIYAFKVARLLGCLALFSLSVVGIISKKNGSQNLGWDGVIHLPEAALVVTFWYNSFLACLSLFPSSWNQSITRHNNFVLLTTFTLYAYRDVWPLATYSGGPIDAYEGPLLWVKLAILTVVAVIIPLFIPRQYIPVDPKHPMEVTNPEQTASIFSLLVYTFLDPIVFEAYSVPHLSHERLPPLADYDYSKKLTSDAFPHLDPFRGAKKEHLFFSFMRVFFWEYLHMTISITLMVFASFASPVAVNRILSSLETAGSDDYIKPWVWVLALFLGPMLVSVSFQWYIYMGTRALARTQGIITELVFEHSLRIRFKAESSKDKESAPSQAVTPADTPDTGSIDGSTAAESADAESTQSRSTAAKGKGKAEPSPAGEGSEKEAKKKDNLIGKINTLVTVDIDNIVESKDFLMFRMSAVLSAASITDRRLYSAIVGFASIIILLPAPGYLATRMQKIQTAKMEKTDARVEAVTETVGVLRMIKLFGWEKKMSNSLKGKREEELQWVWKHKVISLVIDLINFMIPTITMLVTYGTYTLIMGQSLNASKVFSSMSVFDIVRNVLHRSSWMFTQLTKGKVSLDRVGKFLRETELLDEYADQIENNTHLVQASDHHDVIGFRDAVFTWSMESDDGTQTPSSRLFKLKIEGDLTFKQNAINLIVGPTGSGKTSILMALLGEMHFTPSAVDSWSSLPRSGGIAYAAQESWVQNETIRDNILFGSPYDEERYEKVITQCALKRDFELFEAGDRTEVGEKGLTLSGGQKARVTLARAVYSSAQIILLDDILAALDVHTSKWIVEECLKGDLIRGRTVLLVTHNIALTAPIADHIVTVGKDGVAHEIGNDISAVLADPILAHEVKQEKEEAEIEKEVIDTVKKEDAQPDGKLILAEEIAEGRVTWKSMMLFLRGLGGERPIFFMAAYLLGLALMHGGNMLAVWFLGFWGSQYDNRNPDDVDVIFFLSLYSSILVASVMLYAVAATIYNFGTLRASRTINAQLIDSVLGSTLRWLDETPASRIIARCTQDIAAIDGNIAQFFAAVVELGVCMLVKLTGPVIFTPAFLLPGLLVAGLGIYIGNIYLKAQMSVKREMSNARSPVLAHFGAAITGLVSIRAYGAQEAFKKESLKRIDHFLKVSRTSYNLNRWIGIRIDALGATLTAGLASYLLIRRTLSAANIGFSLNMALEFCAMILWLVRCYNEFEVSANSLERIQAYLDIDHEPKATESGKPPAAWPTAGELRVDNLSARYSSTGPKVLHDLSFHVKAGERIGIGKLLPYFWSITLIDTSISLVGRTGSGKSSLTLSLLRCIITDGEVYYDGLSTNKLNLDDLRSNITIIPQMPELLSGTLRRNLDPFDQHDDLTLNNALRASGLFSLQDETDEARLTLDSDISSGGNNLSVGQRQIIALARAIVRNSKLLILDEDHKTDSIIQSSLRHELGTDVTVLTVAHRLQTIMDADKIMVLDSGRIVEFDSPQVLLQMKGGQFKALVDGSGDKKTLYAMVEKQNNASGSS